MSTKRLKWHAVQLLAKSAKSSASMNNKAVECGMRLRTRSAHRLSHLRSKICPCRSRHYGRKQVEEATTRNNILEMKAADLDNCRMAMGSKVLGLTKAESPLEARCQTLQVQHDEVVERGNRESVESVIKERATEETIARLQKAMTSLEVEIGVPRSELSERDATSRRDIAILRIELETALLGKQNGFASSASR